MSRCSKTPLKRNEHVMPGYGHFYPPRISEVILNIILKFSHACFPACENSREGAIQKSWHRSWHKAQIKPIRWRKLHNSFVFSRLVGLFQHLIIQTRTNRALLLCWSKNYCFFPPFSAGSLGSLLPRRALHSSGFPLRPNQNNEKKKKSVFENRAQA